MPVTTTTRQIKSYRKLTFQILKNGKIFREHTLIINPEEYTQDEPARATVIKTLGGAHVDEWGADLITIVIRGTTGYKARSNITGNPTDGFLAFKELRNDIYRYFVEPDGKPKQFSNGVTYELRFFNWEDEEYYAVQPVKFTLQRSKSRPLLYAYDFSMTCLYPIGASKSYRSNISDPVTEYVNVFANVLKKAFQKLIDATNNIRILRG